MLAVLNFVLYVIYFEMVYTNTVKPAHKVTSIKQPPVLKGHTFLVLSQKILCELNLF